MNDQHRGLTWSGKWHIVKESDDQLSKARRYNVSLCGSYVYRDDDPHYPKHLTQIKAGTKKSTGDCKLCNRSIGIKTVTVELPQWDNPGMWPVAMNVTTPAQARSLAAALLAAANAAESNHV